jgi:hypothetical protein
MDENSTTNTTSEDVKKSVSSIYFTLINKRRLERERKEEERRLEKEAKKAAKLEEKESSKETPMTKEEKVESDFNSWKSIIVGLTGDSLEYISTSKPKKKYKKWINEEIENSSILTVKQEKKKKKNYNKEFESELTMLKSIVTDQNRFTSDLLKRYQISAGPNTKDAMPLNKTQVELAAVINTSRANSLGVLREIGNIKKTIADLYLKQRKEDRESGGGGFQPQDMDLQGSNIMKSMFGDLPSVSYSQHDTPITSNDVPLNYEPQITQNNPSVSIQKFDPESWTGNGMDNTYTKFESIPHKIIVEYYENERKGRFKAIREDDGSELIGCPVPEVKVKTFNFDSLTATDDFDQVYPLKIIK